ncbi:MAG: hypothetical protein U1F43_35925 [Myxococcota bacterium]
MRTALFLVLATAVSAACSDAGTTGGVGNLGIAGASCVRTPDCRSPLQCIGEVCTAVGGDTSDASGADGGDAAAEHDGSDAASAHDGSDAAADTQVASDSAETPDMSVFETIAPDSVEPVDTAPGDATSPFQDCGELGVASSWSGPFAGAIDFDVTPNPLTPSTGTLDVEGTLSFDIECIESKFVVRGTMDGNATTDAAVGEFPFTLAMLGTYDPQTKTMTAKLKDGSVSIYGLVIVYFEGDFSGAIGADDGFDGVWSGHSTGTNQQLITGTAEGDGTWSATAQ